MSLSSTELNYLVWRYLQESGFELAAYAFDKQALCLSFEDNKNQEVLSKIESGFLVNLVQKGLLYSLTEEELRTKENRSEILTFFGSLLKEEKDIKMFELGILPNGNPPQESCSSSSSKAAAAKEIKESSPHDIKDGFTTEILTPGFTFNESLLSRWHPSSQVLAFIKEDSNLLISAINDNKIVESATLKGPGLDKINEITALAWSPLGNLVTTANTSGDLCSWSPDGNLRNITKGVIKTTDEPSQEMAIIFDINWSPNGLYFSTFDSQARICIWNSTNLNLIKEIHPSSNSDDTSTSWGFCWLSDLKFALSITSNSIRIMDVINNGSDIEIKLLADLKGHDGIASNVKFDTDTRLLASYSSGDHLIKLWLLNSSSPETAVLTDNDSKISPLILLDWLPNKRLVSISINGIIRIWDITESKLLTLMNIFKDSRGYKLPDDDSHTIGHGSLIYCSCLSPNKTWLVIGDDSGRISIWNINDGIKCQGIFDHYAPDGSILDPESGNGICDISWDCNSSSISISYKGTCSTVLNWKK